MDKNIFQRQLLIFVMLSSCNTKYDRGRYGEKQMEKIMSIVWL